MNAAAKNTALVTCDKCMGKGYLDGFAHYAQGVCFQCSGNGTCEYKPYQGPTETAEEVAEREARYATRLAFVETHRGMTRAQIRAKFAGVSYEQIWALHGFVAALVTAGDADLRPMLAGLADLMERQALAA